ncbi:P-loop containing nucleoside triphosphate hydrolase protein [Dioszegia hungarica]|uniref:P-loop containing nucleoside triphosphate hydrolase protein n=1 Tax=Dioszegia hungarica TaxID=4972 RepID=A0AA38LUL8_9TREE|nr:P-loop containing nucleoside triphosphate hydrolase protein [Dioszegia hungarica]KAI9635054.1 P-loop containing nucleoside triphosphate hydrolase protein [Dioszegia hungarica]
MLLKRLTASVPPDLHPLISQLEAAGIKTTENLLFTPLPTVLSLIDDPDAQYEVEQLIERCLRLTAPVSRSGVEELEEEGSLGKGRWTGFGTAGLDGLVGAWEGRGVVEICGPQRVGKSLLALHIVLKRLLADPASRCKWLDTDGSFSPARARAVLDHMGFIDHAEVLARLSVAPCYNLDPDLWGALDTIRGEDSGQEGARTTILVLDSVTPLLKDLLMGSGSQGHAAMVTMMEEIAELAQSKGLTVIATNATASSRPTNSASTFTATDVKPALGVGFSYFADITLMVQSTGKLFGEIDEGERDRAFSKPGLRGVVEVMKSRVSPTGTWAVFETDGKTLLDVIPAPMDDERTILMTAGRQVGEARPAYGFLSETLAT